MNQFDGVISRMNKWLSGQFHIEMSFYKLDKFSLVVVASEDLLYYHTLEITFHDIDIICGKVDWKVNTGQPVFGILSGEELFNFSIKYRVLTGYEVFYFLDEDGLYTYIAAKNVTMAENTVKYQA